MDWTLAFYAAALQAGELHLDFLELLMLGLHRLPCTLRSLQQSTEGVNCVHDASVVLNSDEQEIPDYVAGLIGIARTPADLVAAPRDDTVEITLRARAAGQLASVAQGLVNLANSFDDSQVASLGTPIAQEATRLVDNEVIDVTAEVTQQPSAASSSQGDSQPKARPPPPALPQGARPLYPGAVPKAPPAAAQALLASRATPAVPGSGV